MLNGWLASVGTGPSLGTGIDPVFLVFLSSIETIVFYDIR